MPYRKRKDLPDSIKGALPAAAQNIWMAAFNAAWAEYGQDEGAAVKVAWTAVKQKYEQDQEGNWVSKKKQVNESVQGLVGQLVGRLVSLSELPAGKSLQALAPILEGWRNAYWDGTDAPARLEEAGRVQAALQEVGAKHTGAESSLLSKVIRYLEIIKDGEVTEAEAAELEGLGIKLKPRGKEDGAAPEDEEQPAEEALGSGLSLEQRSSAVYQAFRALYPYDPEGGPVPDVVETFDEFVIVRNGDAFFQVGYSTDEAGEIAFVGESGWLPVVKKWELVQPAGAAQPATPATPAAQATPATPEATTQAAAAESLQEAVDLVITGRLRETQVSADGTVPCILIVAGESANGNIYEAAVLEAAAPLFSNAPMFVDHPAKSEERDRPERSVRDLAGRLGEVAFADSSLQGPAKISESVGWLKTLITEGIAGDLSINAAGKGKRTKDGKFIVEAITAVRSVDFVTSGAAKGRVLSAVESFRPDSWASLSVESLAEHRPELLNEIASREKDKLYRGKEEVLREAEAAPSLRDQLATSQKRIEELERQQEAREVADVVDQQLAASNLLPPSQNKIREQMQGVRLAEAPARVAQFVQEQKELAAAILEAGKVRGHGSSEPEPAVAAQEVHAAVVSGFERLGLPKDQAETAASRGRKK